MACPLGYTAADSQRKTITPSSSSRDHEKEAEKYAEVHIYPTLTEPKELRKLAKEVIYLTGGQYAILIQWLHPGLAQGSVEHSDFGYRLLDRLQTTSRFLNVAVFGTEEEKKAIFSVIHNKHATVKGEGYDADDPELHRWTAATLFMSLKVVHEAFFGKLSRAKEEAIYRESAIYGTSLRMPTDWWPATLDDFYKYWDHNIATLPVTPWAHTLCRQLMYPSHVPMWFKPVGPIARLLTGQWLPPRLAQEYGLVNNKLERGMYNALRAYVKVTYPLIPRALRQRGHVVGLKDLRDSVKRIDDTGTWVETA